MNSLSKYIFRNKVLAQQRVAIYNKSLLVKIVHQILTSYSVIRLRNYSSLNCIYHLCKYRSDNLFIKPRTYNQYFAALVAISLVIVVDRLRND